MAFCVMCGSPIPDGQNTCSMCYGDPYHGSDGYYLEWLQAQALEEWRKLEDRLKAEEAEMSGERKNWLFQLGQVVATQGVMAKFDTVDLLPYLQRHHRGDWGNVSNADASMNDEAVKSGDTIRSKYVAPDGTELWIVTEADRSVTTFLLPEEN